jgi:hypothetical protein
MFQHHHQISSRNHHFRIGFHFTDDLMMVLKHLERISEHCTNVAESVYFMVHAKIIKHEKFDLSGKE